MKYTIWRERSNRLTLTALGSLLVLGAAITTGTPRPASAEDCTPSPLTVTHVNPANQSGNPGQTLHFHLDITNDDAPTCPQAILQLSTNNLPAGWTATPNPDTEHIDRQEIISYSLSYTSASNATNGTYPLNLTIVKVSEEQTVPQVVEVVPFTYTVVGGAEPDTTAPTVTITSPTANATIKKGSNVTVRAAASDNIGVTKLEFYVGYQLLCTGTSTSCVWRAPTFRGTQTLTVKAYDAANNVSSASVTVNVR